MKPIQFKKHLRQITGWMVMAGVVGFWSSPSLAQSTAEQLSADEIIKAKAVVDVINDKLAKVSQTKSRVRVVESSDIDIQAASDDPYQFALSSSLVARFADDRDALASLIARQLAVVKQKPTPKPEAKKSPVGGKLMGMFRSAVSGAIDSRVGVSGTTDLVTEGSGEVIDAITAQSNEKEVDQLSIAWLLEAGYNPYGSIRAQKSLATLPEGSSGQKLAASPERVAYLEALVDDHPKAKAFAAADKSPLWARRPAPTTAQETTAPATASVSAPDAPPAKAPAD